MASGIAASVFHFGLCEIQPSRAFGQHEKQVVAVKALLIEGSRVLEEAQTNTLPKANKFRGNVSFRGDRLGGQSPNVLPPAWIRPLGT